MATGEVTTIHGRLVEAAHIAGYTFERALGHMEWLLTDARWTGLGFDDVNQFYASIRLDNIRMLAEQRKKLVKLMAAQEKASQRQIGRTLGVAHTTVLGDLDKRGANAPTTPDDGTTKGESTPALGANAPSVLSGSEAAVAASKAERKAVAAEETKARREASRNAPPIHDDLDLRIGDAREVLVDVADESVALVLTDPPYGDESGPLYEWLGEWSARVLVPGGSLICYTGQSLFPRDIKLLSSHLRYWWMLTTRHTRTQRLPGKFIMVGFKPVLWFVKEHRRGRTLVNDVLYPYRPEKVDHDWGQGEAGVSLLIEQLTEPDELIGDPFAGTALWGRIAHNMGRRWVGADIAIGGKKEVLA